MVKKYDVIIVGAGPAGLFAAYELVSKGFKKILLIDKGKSSFSRKPKEVLWGVGGAGLFSDGKLNFTAKLGKTDLTEFLSIRRANSLINYVEIIFKKFGMDGETFPLDKKKAEEYRVKAKKIGIELQVVKQKHLGTDKIPIYIRKLEEYLVGHGVTILPEQEVTQIITGAKKIEGVVIGKRKKIRSNNVLIAPGRSSNNWLTKLLFKEGVTLEQKPIEVGVRIEVPSEILAEICEVIYDPTFYFRTNSFDDQLRTFCTNPVGYVSQEKYKEFVCVNGHAFQNKHSHNANFALLDKVSLSEPVTDTIAYGESICKLASTIGGGKPILQRYIDFKKYRRSTWSRISKGCLEPTLKDVTPGDISMALPNRIVVNLVEGIEKLNEIIPGLASDSTLLYAPEVKFFSVRPKINKNLETEIKGLFVAGDGAGISGNIIGAAATGIIAARGIIAKL